MMKVVLIGDSIRGGYQPFVQRKLKGEIEVVGPKPNCRHSLWALDHFHEWVEMEKPDLVHFNFGIHDVSPQPDGEPQILIDQYRLCLSRFIDKAEAIDVKMIWATCTPLFKTSKETPMSEWEKRVDIEEYNAAALEVVERRGVPVNDLHSVIMNHGYLKCVRLDGCHMEPEGNEVLSDAVVKAIRSHV